MNHLDVSSLSRRERMDLGLDDWSMILEHKITMRNHNFHFSPPVNSWKKGPKGESLPEWEDDIVRNVGWVGSLY